MSARPISKIARAFAEGKPIDRALMRAAKKADLRRRKLGLPVPIWVDGRVVWDPSPPLPVRRKRAAASKTTAKKKPPTLATRRSTRTRKKAG